MAKRTKKAQTPKDQETTQEQPKTGSKLDNLGDKKGTGGFDKNPQNINREGRPRKIYTILKESGYSADDIRIAFGEVAWYNIKDLQALYTNPETPIIIKVVANAYKQAAKNGKFLFIKDILEQFMGKALQKSEEKSEVTHKGDFSKSWLDAFGNSDKREKPGEGEKPEEEESKENQ